MNTARTATAVTTILVAAMIFVRAASPAESAPAPVEASTATDLSPRQVALLWAEVYNSHDPDAAAKLYDENVTNTQLPWGKTTQGRDAMRATYAKVFLSFPDIRVEIDHILEDGEWVAVEWRFSGTMQGEFAGRPPNNQHFSMSGCELFRVVGGKIVTQRGYWDKATMFRQLQLALE